MCLWWLKCWLRKCYGFVVIDTVTYNVVFICGMCFIFGFFRWIQQYFCSDLFISQNIFLVLGSEIVLKSFLLFLQWRMHVLIIQFYHFNWGWHCAWLGYVFHIRICRLKTKKMKKKKYARILTLIYVIDGGTFSFLNNLKIFRLSHYFNNTKCSAETQDPYTVVKYVCVCVCA